MAMVIVYNVTVKIDVRVRDEWLKWMKEVHIPDVMNTGLFSENKIMRILGEDETEAVTYAIQYLCPNMETFNRYQKEFAPALQADHTARYKNRYIAFRTLMELES